MNTPHSKPLFHGQAPASAWVLRWSHLLAPHSTVLDLACGYGRHMQHLASLGHRVTGLDRNPDAIAAVRAWGDTVCADIENGPWPLADHTFGAVVVTHYLWRPVFAHILNSLAEGGVLIYETFAAGNASVGKPSRPDFLLATGELLALCQGLRIVAFEEGFLDTPERFVQRIVAIREHTHLQTPVRYPLSH